MSQLVRGGSLTEFFKGLVGEVVKRQRVTLDEVTEFYVVNLLSEYATAEKLFTERADGRRDTEPLALMYHKALLQERSERISTLRRLGDVSLYTAGFFQQSLRDRPVGAAYYVQMGRTAYGAIAEMTSAGAVASVYSELQHKFLVVVEVLEEISARSLASSGPKGQMQIFESWSRTHNGRLESVLIDVGLLPRKGPAN